jgi:sugar phosphate isomerase/epimerase
MELCFSTFNESAWFGATPDLAAHVRAAAAAGFDAVGLDVFSLGRCAEAGTSVEALAAEIARAGVRCAELTGLWLGPDPREPDPNLPALLAAARALRPEWVLVNADCAVDANAAEAFARAADAVRGAGARLALEFLPFTRVRRIADALALVERSGVPDAGVLVDTWHFFQGPDAWPDLAALPLERLAYVQFDDHPEHPATGDLREELLHRRALPGEGAFDLARFSRELRARGFDGLVSVEVLSRAWRGGDVAEFTRRAFAATRRYWPAQAGRG